MKGYPPGVRENGGQYTHGAIWSIFAWARLGDGDRAGGLFDLLNPIHHGDSTDAVARYKVEPYVACADVYSVAPYIGRGGWTWYTGSAGLAVPVGAGGAARLPSAWRPAAHRTVHSEAMAGLCHHLPAPW
ncbi:GH36-type glycosyl hydrolase domain-containing protein [Rhodanobacter lindaniclasticus]